MNNFEKALRYLQDLHAAECGTEQIVLTHAVNELAPAAVREACSTVVMQCRNRQRLLEERLVQLGGEVSSSKDWIDVFASKIFNLWTSGHDNVERMTLDLVKAHAGGHLLHGAYCALYAFSDSIGDLGTREIAEKGMAEAESMSGKLIPLIDRVARYAPSPV